MHGSLYILALRSAKAPHRLPAPEHQVQLQSLAAPRLPASCQKAVAAHDLAAVAANKQVRSSPRDYISAATAPRIHVPWDPSDSKSSDHWHQISVGDAEEGVVLPCQVQH